jgi:dihydroorotate dehydrogenase (fumarate)
MTRTECIVTSSEAILIIMNLTTTYLGLELRSPLVVGAAAPLSEDLDNIKRLEDAGAAAIVLHSLFEEQIERETLDFHHHSRISILSVR